MGPVIAAVIVFLFAASGICRLCWQYGYVAGEEKSDRLSHERSKALTANRMAEIATLRRSFRNSLDELWGKMDAAVDEAKLLQFADDNTKAKE